MEQPESGLTYARAMTVHARAVTAESDLLKLARQRATDPAVLEQYPPYFWSGEISSTRWDAYFSRMAESTLRNFAEDATAGVAFLRNHDTRSDPVGHSLTGQFVGGQGNGVARVTADFYALPTPEVEPYLAKIRGGIVRDLSVGFYGGQWICSLCGRDMQQWFGPNACPHLLGMQYTPRDEAGQQKGEPEVARATIENARLAETSGVYDGATPGAMVSKARMLATDGQLSTQQRDLVEVRYRIHLPSASRSWPGTTLETRQQEHGSRAEGTDSMPEGQDPGQEQTRAQPPTGEPAGTGQQPAPPAAQPAPPATTTHEEHLRSIRAHVAEVLGETTPADALEAVRAMAVEVGRLRPLADDGRQYRTDLVSEALAEGVRAHGAEFAAESYKGLLETAPLVTIKRMRDDWKRIGDTQFAGGRQTEESGQPPAQKTDSKAGLPVAAHRA